MRLNITSAERDVNTTDISDLVPGTRTGTAYWADDGENVTGLEIPYSTDPTPWTQAQIDAVTNRLLTSGANEEDIRGKALQAITVNNNFLAIGSPTNAQTLTQVQRLTRECTGIIRLLLHQLDSTAGT